MAEVIEALVDGGKATAGPPLGPALGPLGVNIMEVVKAINEKTKAFQGMKVPVKVVVDPNTKSFEISVGTPPTSALIKKELGLEKGSGDARKTKVGNLTLEQVKKISEMKKDSLLGKDIKSRAKEIIGTCQSMGVTVEGKNPKDILKEIDEGKYDDVLR
jgi:large subunit ribosomal protein L11